jgi:hypothetical protein
MVDAMMLLSGYGDGQRVGAGRGPGRRTVVAITRPASKSVATPTLHPAGGFTRNRVFVIDMRCHLRSTPEG